MGRFRRPLRSAKGSLLNLSCVGSTRRAQNLSHVPGSHTTLPGYGRWSRPPTECVSTPSPREPSAALHNGRKMPMEGFGVFQVRDKEECKRSVLEAIKAGYPVFEHRDLANICETTVLACCIPAFLDKLKNPAYTYNVGRVFGKADVLSLGHPICFKNRKSLLIRHHSSKQS